MPRSFDSSAVRRIWVRAPNWLGDFVMATASFERLRRAFPQARITAGMRGYLKPLLAGCDWFDEVVETPRSSGLGAFWREVRAMRAAAFDLAVVLPNSLATGLVPFCAGVPERAGWRQGRPWLLNIGPTAEVRRRWWQPRIGPRRTPKPMPEYYRELLDHLELPPGGVHPVLPVADADRRWVADHLRTLGIGADERLALFVVGENFGACLLWPQVRFAAAAAELERRAGVRALVLVGPSEVELGERIARDGGAICLSQPVLPLDKLKALVARGAVMVTGDTGPRHLGVAYDLPVVCLIGPTDPAYTNYCLERTGLLRRDLPCVPCQRKVCPLGHHRCMRDIQVDEVVAAAERLLAAPPAGRTG
ncbi:MAG: lipopolysaccharide heptosyltransferase II [Planctomycetota bacterium]